jgi:hypothetical protein
VRPDLLRSLLPRGNGHAIRPQSRRVEDVANGAADASLVNHQLAAVSERRPLQQHADALDLLGGKADRRGRPTPRAIFCHKSKPGTAFQSSNWFIGSRHLSGSAACTASPRLPRKPLEEAVLRERAMDKPTEEQIRQRAHELWEQGGRPEGREAEFWHQAERELHEKEELRDKTNEPPPTILPG